MRSLKTFLAPSSHPAGILLSWLSEEEVRDGRPLCFPPQLLFCVLVFVLNAFSVLITYMMSSVWHAVLDNFRPVSIWAVQLTLYYGAHSSPPPLLARPKYRGFDGLQQAGGTVVGSDLDLVHAVRLCLRARYAGHDSLSFWWCSHFSPAAPLAWPHPLHTVELAGADSGVPLRSRACIQAYLAADAQSAR
eukprot:6190871-Pleurochrysis_carterae.AAC.3